MSELSQLPIKRGLKWWASDPLSLTAVIKGVDWSGTYTGDIRDGTGASVLTLTVTATYATPDTTFTFVCADTSDVEAGTYYWDCTETDGPTRFAGSVLVESHPY